MRALRLECHRAQQPKTLLKGLLYLGVIPQRITLLIYEYSARKSELTAKKMLMTAMKIESHRRGSTGFRTAEARSPA